MAKVHFEVHLVKSIVNRLFEENFVAIAVVSDLVDTINRTLSLHPIDEVIEALDFLSTYATVFVDIKIFQYELS